MRHEDIRWDQQPTLVKVCDDNLRALLCEKDSTGLSDALGGLRTSEISCKHSRRRWRMYLGTYTGDNGDLTSEETLGLRGGELARDGSETVLSRRHGYL